MADQAPSVGRIVHYVSHGSPVRPDGTQAYTSQCRAAIITEVGAAVPFPGTVIPSDEYEVALCVLNPTGQFFSPGCRHDEDEKAGGTWHWPERV